VVDVVKPYALNVYKEFAEKITAVCCEIMWTMLLVCVALINSYMLMDPC
jgi:hypothetical protein